MCFNKMLVSIEDWAKLLDQEPIMELSHKAGMLRQINTQKKEEEKKKQGSNKESFID